MTTNDRRRVNDHWSFDTVLAMAVVAVVNLFVPVTLFSLLHTAPSEHDSASRNKRDKSISSCQRESEKKVRVTHTKVPFSVTWCAQHASNENRPPGSVQT